MAKYRVKAFFMHEHELDAAQAAERDKLLTNVDWTPGYAIGVVDQRNIKQLVDQGLVVTPIEKIDEEAAAGRVRRRRGARRADPAPSLFEIAAARHASLAAPRPVTVSAPDKNPNEKITSYDPDAAQFYIVRLHGPVTEERRRDLEQVDLKLLECLSNNRYTIRLKPEQLGTLAALPFVDTIRLYTEADTVRIPPEVVAPKREPRAARRRRARGDARRKPAEPARALIYDIRLHRAEDLNHVVAWLEQRSRRPLSAHADMLRVVLGGNDVVDLAKLPEVAAVELMRMPRTLDREARRILRLEQAGAPDLGLEGDGQIIGIADTGLDDHHPDFSGRITGISARGRSNDHSDPEGHGTHVAGCALGNGSSSGGQIQGAAPKAKLFFQSILDSHGGLGGLPDNLEDLFEEAYAQGVRIHNNSWGAFAFAAYGRSALDVDRFVFDHPDMLIVIAAGNDGLAVPRRAGGQTNSTAGFVDWPCVADPATAKNGVTVGASRNTRTAHGYSMLTWGEVWSDRYPKAPIAKEKISGKDECLAAFSSRGPSDANQIKPDVVAPGTDIAAAKSAMAPLRKFWGAFPNNANYAFMGGTSMAAPYVAGCAALVREWCQKRAHWAEPSAALLKAMLINGTHRLSGRDAVAELKGDPNFHQGFGRIDMANTLPNPMQPKLKLVFADTWKNPASIFNETGQCFRYRVGVGTDLPLRICLAYTDVPARSLQNKLFLIVDNQAGEKFPGNADAAAVLRISGLISDPNNNVQIVRIDQPQADTFTIAITAGNLLRPPQSFALVVTGDLTSQLEEIPSL
jgi:subtilisin family serine protease